MRKPVCTMLAATVLAAGFSFAEAVQKPKTATGKPKTASPASANTRKPFETIELSEAELRKLARKKVVPDYPCPDYMTRIIGNVQVQVMVNPSGKVVDVQFLDGPALLRVAVVRAARRWEFLPPLREGKSVGVSGILTFQFDVSGVVKQD